MQAPGTGSQLNEMVIAFPLSNDSGAHVVVGPKLVSEMRGPQWVRWVLEWNTGSAQIEQSPHRVTQGKSLNLGAWAERA